MPFSSLQLAGRALTCIVKKPLSYDVTEGIAMVNAGEKPGILSRSDSSDARAGFMKAKELIENGRIGEVHRYCCADTLQSRSQDTKIQPPAIT